MDTSRRKKKPKILVIMPAYNEEKAIGKTLKEIRAKAPFIEDIVIIDDGSKDRTAEIASSQNARVVRLPINLGIGGAVQTGFKYAMLNGYDIALQIDADMQHDPSYARSIIKPIVEGKADISIGSRYFNGGHTEMPRVRNIGIRYFSWLTSKIVGHSVTDCSSGYRALNSKAFRFFSKNYPVDFPDAEALVIAHKAGLRIAEVNAPFRKRKRGRSSLRSLKLLYYPLKETFAILVLLTRRVNRIE
nr:glycosyltransferase family 2 protein [Candidatus Njordarchaeota archaeon]